MLTRIGAWARGRAAQQMPWTNVYGVARSLLAIGTLATLVFTPTAYLFQRAAGVPVVPVCMGAGHIGAFCLAGHTHLDVARWLLVAGLLLVASGYRPRLTALLHWWIAFSLHNNAVILDGGEQVTLVLTTLMLPLALTDRRRWHWSKTESVDPPLTTGDELRRIVGLFGMWTLRIQVAAIYFHAGVAKFGVEEWVDGTAVYYFFRNPAFGASPFVLRWLDPILYNPVGVCSITWGTLAIEYLLSAALFMPKRHWRKIFIAGILLHSGIMVVHGLVSFALAMFAALVVYLRPFEQVFVMPKLLSRDPSFALTRTAAEGTT
jgi:antimicrobial peptide system SdpB family protein